MIMMALKPFLGGTGVKEKYTEPMLLLIYLQQEDIITTSPTSGDNTLEDGFFD